MRKIIEITFTKFWRTFKINEFQEIFSNAWRIERDIFAKRDIGIKKLKIFRKIINSGLWKRFIDIYSENKNKIIAEKIPEDTKTIVEIFSICFISLYFFPPRYQEIYLSNPSVSPKEEKATNHPKTIIASENNP